MKHAKDRDSGDGRGVSQRYRNDWSDRKARKTSRARTRLGFVLRFWVGQEPWGGRQGEREGSPERNFCGAIGGTASGGVTWINANVRN